MILKNKMMLRGITVLMTLLPVAALAQESDPDLMKDPAKAGLSQQATLLTSEVGGGPIGSDSYSGLGNPIGPEPDAPTQQKPKAAQPIAAVLDSQRPKIEGSMIGYIENAIVGSQVRIRFDGAFNTAFPDRAEFIYAKCACYRNLASQAGVIQGAFDPNAPGPGPGIATNLNFQQLYINVEYALHSRFSLFSEVPFRWLQPQEFEPIPSLAPFTNQAGIGDVRAGFKLALLGSADHYLTFQFKSYFPSGDASKGMGTNHFSIEPALLYYQRLSNRAALELQIGDTHPIRGSAGVPTAGSDQFAGDVFFYGIGPSYVIYSGERVRFAPVVELVGWGVLGGFQTHFGGLVIGAADDASGTNIVNIKVGACTSIGAHNSFYVGYGRALTNAAWYKDLVRVEYRYSF